jgi:hypothetical protein
MNVTYWRLMSNEDSQSSAALQRRFGTAHVRGKRAGQGLGSPHVQPELPLRAIDVPDLPSVSTTAPETRHACAE